MKPLVVDASVLVKLFFEEDYSEVTEKWIKTVRQPLAPDFIRAEVANVVWLRHRRGDVSKAKVELIIQHLIKAPLITTPSVELISAATELAIEFDRAVYDCMYLALAVRSQCSMICDDRKLINTLKGTPLEKHIVWIGSLA